MPFGERQLSIVRDALRNIPNSVIFHEVYFARLSMNFSIVAPEAILAAFEAPADDPELVKVSRTWEGLLECTLSCYVIQTSSTASEIKIIAKDFLVENRPSHSSR